MNGLMIYFGNEWERTTWQANYGNAAMSNTSKEPRRRLRLRNLFQLSRRPRSERRSLRTWRSAHPAG